MRALVFGAALAALALPQAAARADARPLHQPVGRRAAAWSALRGGGGGSALAPVSLFLPAVFRSSLGAVSELALSAGLGFGAMRTGLVTQEGIAQLAQIVYNFLLPLFLLTSVLRTVVTYGLGAGMLCLPLAGAVQIGVALALASLSLRLLGVSRGTPNSRRFLVCASFGNSGVLPLLLTDALFRQHADPTVLPRAASYISFYLLGWSPIFWTVGSSIITGAGPGAAPGRAGGVGHVRLLARKVLTPPIVGALSGLALAVVAPRAWLESPASPLRLALTCMGNMARAYPPTALLVLCGSLAGGAAPAQRRPPARRERAGAPRPRELSMPATLLGIMASTSPARSAQEPASSAALRLLSPPSAVPPLTLHLPPHPHRRARCALAPQAGTSSRRASRAARSSRCVRSASYRPPRPTRSSSSRCCSCPRSRRRRTRCSCCRWRATARAPRS